MIRRATLPSYPSPSSRAADGEGTLFRPVAVRNREIFATRDWPAGTYVCELLPVTGRIARLGDVFHGIAAIRVTYPGRETLHVCEDCCRRWIGGACKKEAL